MNPLKKITIALGICATAFATAATAAVNIVTTTTDLGTIARAIGETHVTVTTLARSGEDPHFVDARPSFLRILNRADLLVEGGADLESGWLPPLVNNARNPKILRGAPGHFSAASAGIPLLNVPAILDRSQGDVHPSGNPHFLTDPGNAVRVANSLAKKLAQIDPTNAAAYLHRADQFQAKIKQKTVEWKRRLAPLRGTQVVTYHESYDYFLAAFDLKLAGTIEPKPGVEPSAAHLIALINHIKTAKVKLILAEPNRPSRPCERITSQTDAKLLRLPLMPSPSQDYIAFIEGNISALETSPSRPPKKPE
ncbi:MAG: metal ABC transporter substrate-binding protein [Puniceicoccales bacterium]|jgi:ABC-type Zn uptake system ZnuABC Zn-binding protein ZnuA|nr:metal ABC transporter substrate-binding protein [Puniceicoccales bacterium]